MTAEGYKAGSSNFYSIIDIFFLNQLPNYKNIKSDLKKV